MLNIEKLKRNKKFKIAIFIFAIFICAVSISNIIVASDINHIAHCHEENCSYCAIIHFCQFQIRISSLSIPPMIAILIILNRQKYIDYICDIKKRDTLVACKIQLNE